MNKVEHGNCLERLKELSDNSVDSIITDPPYGLSFMGKRWDYDVPSVEIWRECLRVLKPGGHMLAFAGTRTQHRMAVRIEDAGFEIRDMIAWVYGSGFPKSHNLNGEWKGWGTALKPALEPITVARKPFKGTVANNVAEYGTGAINIDGCRVGIEKRFNAAAGNKPGKNSLNMSQNGMPQDADGKECFGRWPANLIHDGSDEVASLIKDSARFFYCAKASKTDREEGCEDLDVRQTIGGGGTNDPNGDDVCGKYGSVKSPSKNNHPTVKPTDLMRYLCRLVTPNGGLVLDPFAGSGSTGKAATLEGFNFIGFELDENYVKIANKRIKFAEKQMSQDTLCPFGEEIEL